MAGHSFASQIGRAIISKGDSNPMPKEDSVDKGAMSATRRIEIEPADNGGVTVHHYPKPKPHTGKKDAPYDYTEGKETHVFGDAKSAHAHLSKMMGCD